MGGGHCCHTLSWCVWCSMHMHMHLHLHMHLHMYMRMHRHRHMYRHMLTTQAVSLPWRPASTRRSCVLPCRLRPRRLPNRHRMGRTASKSARRSTNLNMHAYTDGVFRRHPPRRRMYAASVSSRQPALASPSHMLTCASLIPPPLFRLLVEKTRCAKCPSIADHLSGAKKIQQALVSEVTTSQCGGVVVVVVW